MRALHVVPALSPLYGGPTQAALEMCRELNRHGLPSEIATTNADVDGTTDMPLERPVDRDGVTVHCFDSPRLRKYGYSPRLSAWLARNAGEFDVLHVHCVFSALTWPATRHARRHGVPYVIRPLGQLNPGALRKSALLKRLYMGLVGRRCFDRAAAIHVTSEVEREAVARQGFRARSIVIPHGLVREPDDAIPRRGAYRERHGLTAGTRLVLFLSRLDPIKGLDQLIPAVRLLAARRRDFAVVLAGSGEPAYERALRDLVAAEGVSELVRFAGFVQREDKRALLRDADVFVLPSYSENFGLAVVEAMAAGLPVVISEHVGIQREVARAEAGTVTAAEAARLAEALSALLDDAGLRERMGRNGRRLVRETFAWDRVAPALISLYEAVRSRG